MHAALRAADSMLLVVDLQARLMPAIHDGQAVVDNARRLLDAARLLDVPAHATEQYPRGLGGTVPGLLEGRDVPVTEKAAFDACRTPGFVEALPARPRVVVIGCEAHVCVLQTVLGLRAAGRDVALVRDAIGSRRPENRDAAVERLARHGVEIVTTEMVVFEWLGGREHPRFKDALALIR